MKTNNFKYSQKNRGFHKKNPKEGFVPKRIDSDRWDHSGFEMICEEDNKKSYNFQEKRKYPSITYKKKYNNFEINEKNSENYFTKDKKLYIYEPKQLVILKNLNKKEAEKSIQKNQLPDRQLYKPGMGLKVSKNKDKNNDDKISSVSTAALSDRCKVLDEENSNNISLNITKEEDFKTIEENNTDIESDEISKEIIKDLPSFLEFTLNLADQKVLIKIDKEENFDKTINEVCKKFGIEKKIVVCMKISIVKSMKSMEKFSNCQEKVEKMLDLYIEEYRKLLGENK